MGDEVKVIILSCNQSSKDSYQGYLCENSMSNFADKIFEGNFTEWTNLSNYHSKIIKDYFSVKINTQDLFQTVFKTADLALNNNNNINVYSFEILN